MGWFDSSPSSSLTDADEKNVENYINDVFKKHGLAHEDSVWAQIFGVDLKWHYGDAAAGITAMIIWICLAVLVLLWACNWIRRWNKENDEKWYVRMGRARNSELNEAQIHAGRIKRNILLATASFYKMTAFICSLFFLMCLAKIMSNYH